MSIDVDSCREGQVFDADVVVIGGGPAGLSVALESASGKHHVMVLESGGVAQTLLLRALSGNIRERVVSPLPSAQYLQDRIVESRESYLYNAQ